MKSHRTKIGIIFSVIWIGVIVGLMLNHLCGLQKLKLNELGDFLAGASAPLAFLWLVLGYFQQGEELKSSTDALKQQADELKKSVEQQEALVVVTRQQVEAQRDALLDEKKELDRLSKPSLALSGFYNWEYNQYYFEVNILNTGHEAISFSIDVPQGSEITSASFYPIFKSKETIKLTFRSYSIPNPTNFNIFFYYLDGRERQVQQRFSISTEEQSKLNFMLVEA